MPKQLVLAITGGGTEVIGSLLKYGGASSYMLEAIVPYSNQSLMRFINDRPAKFASEQVARKMANAAYDRAENLSSSHNLTDLVGIGVTASLGKAGVERAGREHPAYIAVRTHDSLSVNKWSFKEPRTRSVEEEALAGIIHKTVNDYIFDSVKVENSEYNIPILKPTEFEYLKVARDKYGLATLGKYQVIMGQPLGMRPAIMPGSFNPIHDGHIRMVKHMANKLNKPVYLEISVGNVDKLSLDIIDVAERVESIEKALDADPHFKAACAGVILCHLPTFYEKMWAYNNAEFVLGEDTGMRLFDSKYSGSTFAGPSKDKMIDLCQMNMSPIFHILPRPGHKMARDFNPDYQKYFNFVDDFEGSEESSTKIREATVEKRVSYII